MNTITIMSTVEGQPNVTYTEGEVQRFIEKAKTNDSLNEMLNKNVEHIRSIKNAVRDFFSEVEWEDGEQTVSKSDVNDLLERIGTHRLTSKYRANFTITGTYSVEAEDEESAEETFKDNVNVEFYDGDIDVEYIEVDDLQEDN